MPKHWLKPREPIAPRLFWAGALLSLAGLWMVWSLLTYGGLVKDFFLPTPSEVWRTLTSMLRSGELWTHTLSSVQIILTGWAAAALFAIPIGVLIGSFGILDALFAPLSSFVRYLPVSALIPLIILYVGIDDSARITVIFLGTFFQLLLMIADTAARTPRDLIDSAYTLGAQRWSIVSRIILPASLPGILDALRLNLGAAWTYVVVAEMIAAERGLGYMILDSMRSMTVSRIFCGLLVIGILGFLADRLFSLLHRRLLPWSAKVSG